jgi:signal transduction histidine kinase
MVGVMLATLAGVSLFNAFTSARRERWRIERDLREVAGTLADSNFPLTDGVLRQMRGLSGAEFVWCDRRGSVIASSTRDVPLPALPEQPQAAGRETLTLGDSIVIGDRRFFHAPLQLRRLTARGEPTILHVLYPEESYRQAWRHAVYPPLVVGAAAIVLVVLFGLAIASRVTRPMHRLQSQVEEIAQGSFRQVPVPRRDDEIADLSRSINRMAEMLARYEGEVRRSEQLRTLGQLGSGIGHQMRNAVTGCRLAIELHDRQCPMPGERESLDVARRQLELMEKYLKRFLSLGRTDARPHRRTDLVPVVDNVVSLVRPTARHMGVTLTWEPPDAPVAVQGDADAMEQLLVNLVLNAIEAASRTGPIGRGVLRSRAEHPETAHGVVKEVVVSVTGSSDRVLLEVSDSGPGPAPEVRDRLFEPFVTEKPDGTGLGLWVVCEIAVSHGGEVRWERRDASTCFTVELPPAVGPEGDGAPGKGTEAHRRAALDGAAGAERRGAPAEAAQEPPIEDNTTPGVERRNGEPAGR